MGLFNKKIRFPSSRDVDKAEDSKRRAEQRRAEREAYQKAFAQARIARASREGSQAGSRRWYDSFSNISVGTPTPHRTLNTGHRKHVKKKTKHRHSGRRRSNTGFFDVGGGYDITDNWGFLK